MTLTHTEPHTETTVNQPFVHVDHITTRYANGAGIDDIDLQMRRGEMLVLLGPSGCGKSTLLRTIAGLTQADQGRVLVDGQDITGLPAARRDMGMVFQTWALFPHMTVAENVAYGLKTRKTPKAKIGEAVREALELVQLSHLAGRRPSQLSGGQQQRVALARAVVINPRVLLLDEPLSALDRRIRMDLRADLRKLQQDLGVTGIYVTHDHGEALALGDRVAIMDDGKIVELGKPRDLFVRPERRFTAQFLDAGSIVDAETPAGSTGRLTTPVGTLTGADLPTDAASICIPTDAVTLNELPADGLRGVIGDLDYEQSSLTVTVDLPELGVTLKSAQPLSRALVPGQEVAVRCDLDRAVPLRP